MIGGGVVGLAIARALAPSHSVALLERHTSLGAETSGRNSGVLHAGLYYPTDSLKTQLCIRGRQLLVEYCEARAIPYALCGKLVIAHHDRQREALHQLQVKAQRLGVPLRPLTAADIQCMEPEVTGVAGVYSPNTGIVDVQALLMQLDADIQAAHGHVLLGQKVINVTRQSSGFCVEVDGAEPVHCAWLINAAGFEAPLLAQQMGALAPQILPVKGHYFQYAGTSPFQHLVYPMPEPHGVGLGIHATLDISGAVRFGPDVERVSQLDYRVDASRKPDFVAAIQRYYPGLDPERLSPDYAGIRPKLAVDAFADFRIDGERQHGIPGLVNLFGIESPGLTASLAIAETVRDGLHERYKRSQ